MLNTPVSVRNLTLKNRLLLPPMAIVKGDEEGTVTEKTLQYYADAASRGWFGLIVSEHSFVSLEGRASANQLSVSRDADIEGLSRLADSVHRYDAPVFLQINHAGGAAKRSVTGCMPVSPSGIRSPGLGDPDIDPLVMTVDEIRRITDCFVQAARRAQKAGFDGVEVHAAHSYLLCQFFSPLLNRREDDYNGFTLEGRTRFTLEVLRAVRDAVGSGFPISIRLGGCDFTEGGSTPEDAARAAALYEAAGADLFDVSGGYCYYRRPGHREPGYFAEETKAVKGAVRAPVVLTGGITSSADAERFLSDGSADLIGVGRGYYKSGLDLGSWL